MKIRNNVLSIYNSGFGGQTMKQKSVGFKTGVILAAIHLCLVIFAFCLYVTSKSSTAGLVFIWFFTLDAPIEALRLFLPAGLFSIGGLAAPLIMYGLWGSLMWFFIAWLTDRLVIQLFRNTKWVVRVVIIIIASLLLLRGFSRLNE